MTVQPVRREVLVEATPERTFQLFTDAIGQWWPLRSFGVFGDGTVAFEGNQVVERSAGRSSVWAEVLEWDPPTGLRLAWHPGSPVEEATDLTVQFVGAGGDQTLVRVIHAGWDKLADGAETAKEYFQGWPRVLAGLADLSAREQV